MIFSAGLSWLHAHSSQASEKSAWLFSLFGFGRFLAIALICNALLACISFTSCFVAVSILLRGCTLIVSKIDLTWPNQPGPCGTLWSSHYNNISHVVRAGRRVISSLLFEVFIPNTGELVTLQYLSLCSFYFYFFGRGVSSLYRTHNTKVKLLVSLCSFS